MKYIIVIALNFALSACTLFSQTKVVKEVVPSCFSDDEDQTKMCKAFRKDEDSRIVVTRCIGTQNREANPILRGKCVEKICPEGSNVECEIKGEIRVLQQYAELARSNMFHEPEASEPAPPKKMSAKEKRRKAKLAKAGHKEVAHSELETEEVDVDPSASLPPLPQKPEAVTKATPAPKKRVSGESELPQVSVSLKPAKAVAKKVPASPNRGIASVKSEEGFKRVCVKKNDMEAPLVLRGKCATRNCDSGGKCSYKGRKEMFDYIADSQG